MHTVIFDITGMNCAACSARVEKSVSVLAGVRDVAVNLLKNTLTLSADPELVSTADVVAAVTKAGYGATLRTAGNAAKAAPPPDPAAIALAALRRRLAVSLTFTVPLFLLVMGPMAGLPLPGFFQGAENALAFALTQFLLALPVLFACGALYRTGFKALLSGAPNMDSLIAIGSGAAALFSVCAFYEMAFALGRGDLATVARFAANLYFDSAAMILTLITLGRFFEARAKGRTSEAITKLMDLAPRTATLLRDGEERVIPRDAVVPGDILVVRTGERVPVDGIITSGSGFLDESALSGESLPLEKQAGDTVTGATINTSGYFLMRATRVGEDTTLAQIIRLVDEATSSKAPIARLADRVSGIFVPVVIVIALSATAFWLLCGYGAAFALSIGIAVLVISCPCALGLATPTAIMVGTGRGASLGILLKSAEAIETAGIVDTVVLDKTGTVTEGRPALTDLIPAEPADAAEAVDATELLTLAASLEKLSEHPLGAAIVREAETRGLTLRPVSGFTRMPGQGIAGTMDGEGYAAGNAKLLTARGVADSLAEQAEKLAAEGRTALYVLRGARLLGCIAVADAVKAGSSGAVAELAGMGIAVIMLTGDNAVTAAAVGRQVGIGTVVAGVSPQDKEREIRALQEAGHHVAMVGDGVNDAPALARADVGIAIGAGTDVALESADIVLMKSELPDAVAAIRLSRAVMRAIRQNLFWAFFYNCIGIPVAAGALYPAFGWTLSPVLGAAAMGISSVCVVTNALRLRWTPLRPAGDTQHSVPARKNSMKKTIKIEGMNCGHCSASVERALKALAGVSAVQVDLASKSATLEVAGVSDAVLAKAVTDAGFEVVGIN